MDGDSSSLISVFCILFLLFSAAYFAVCETAFASVSRVRLKLALDRGTRGAKDAAYVAEHFDEAITTILIGTNIVHLAAASLVTVLVTRRWGVGAVAVSTAVTTVVVFFAGEMLPKSIGKTYSERLSLAVAGSLRLFMRLFRPLSALLTALGGFASRLVKGEAEVTVTEDELYDIIDNMTDGGELDEEQGELVKGALSFGDVTVERILTARVDLAAIELNWPQEKVLDTVRSARHSRIPVYEGTVDNIIGTLQIRKYIKAWLEERENVSLRSLLDEPYFIHQSAKIDELLPLMSGKKVNMAVVTDNYGGTLGVVTVEDILEELVGEIWDEEDLIEEPCVRNPDGSCTFDASVEIESAFAFMDYTDPDDFDFEHKLLGEWTYEQFDHLPGENDSFRYNGLTVTVEKVEQRRIRKLRIARESGGEPEEAA